MSARCPSCWSDDPDQSWSINTGSWPCSDEFHRLADISVGRGVPAAVSGSGHAGLANTVHVDGSAVGVVEDRGFGSGADGAAAPIATEDAACHTPIISYVSNRFVSDEGAEDENEAALRAQIAVLTAERDALVERSRHTPEGTEG